MPDEYAVWDQMFPPERRASEYEGLTRQEAEERARVKAVATVRVADWDLATDTAFTSDLRPQRLNLLIHHGRVARAGFG